jgi:hypothetical protein
MGKTTNEAVTNKVISQTTDLSARMRHGRAVNAVADYLRSQLRVPNVYIDPSGAGLSRIDVLAADAAGSGDIHAVEVKLLTAPTGPKTMRPYVDIAKTLPAHFKYLAITQNITNIEAETRLFSTDGIGRVGILLVTESGDCAPTVELAVKPERFRIDASELTQIERFLSRAQPDMYVRV